jgi:hypothetical protein
MSGDWSSACALPIPLEAPDTTADALLDFLALTQQAGKRAQRG